MPEHEVTLGEVYRAVIEIRQEQREMRKDLIGRAEYESDQEGIDRRFKDSTDTHVRLENAIDAISRRQDSTEKEQRQAKSRWLQSIAIAALGAVLAVVVPLMLRGVL